MGRFLFKTISKQNLDNNPYKCLEEGVEILADFYLEWQEALEDYKNLRNFEETDETIFNENVQRDNVRKILAEILVNFAENDGENFVKNIQAAVRELKICEIQDANQFYLKITEILKRHLLELVEASNRLKLSREAEKISEIEAKFLIDTEIGMDFMDFEEISPEKIEVKERDFGSVLSLARRI